MRTDTNFPDFPRFPDFPEEENEKYSCPVGQVLTEPFLWLKHSDYLRSRGDFVPALCWAQKALAALSDVFGKDCQHPALTMAHNCLGHIYQDKGQKEDALKHYHAAMQIFQTVGTEEQKTISTRDYKNLLASIQP